MSAGGFGVNVTGACRDCDADATAGESVAPSTH